MAQIIEFIPKKTKKKMSEEAKRLKAIVEGSLACYTCNTCGGDIEVIDDDYPKVCPCCGVEIEEWNN